MTALIISDQFSIIQNLQRPPISQTSNLEGTFLEGTLHNTGSSSDFRGKYNNPIIDIFLPGSVH